MNGVIVRVTQIETFPSERGPNGGPWFTAGNGVLGALLLVLLLLPSVLTAQEEAYEGPTTVLEGVYTEEQADRGRELYDRECALCHGPREFSGRVFQLAWSGRPVGAFYTQTRMTMPFDSPGRLSEQQYADIVAYILELNSYPAGDEELPTESRALNRIQIEEPADEDSRSR